MARSEKCTVCRYNECLYCPKTGSECLKCPCEFCKERGNGVMSQFEPIPRRAK